MKTLMIAMILAASSVASAGWRLECAGDNLSVSLAGEGANVTKITGRIRRDVVAEGTTWTRTGADKTGEYGVLKTQVGAIQVYFDTTGTLANLLAKGKGSVYMRAAQGGWGENEAIDCVVR